MPGGSDSCTKAIVERRLLGYLQSAIVPYAHSQSKEMDERGVRQEVSHLRLVRWATARTCVLEFPTEAVRDGSSSLPGSNRKWPLGTSCVLELIETTSNNMKLNELLQDEAQRQSDCAVAGAWAHGGARHRN